MSWGRMCFALPQEWCVGVTKGQIELALPFSISIPCVAGLVLFLLLTLCSLMWWFLGVHSIFTAGFVARFNYFDKQKQEHVVLFPLSLSWGLMRKQRSDQRCRLWKRVFLSMWLLPAFVRALPGWVCHGVCTLIVSQGSQKMVE